MMKSTDRIREALHEAAYKDSKFQPYVLNDVVPLKILQAVVQASCAEGKAPSKRLWLHELVAGSRPTFELAKAASVAPVSPVQQAPGYAARIRKLQAAEQKRQYEELLHGPGAQPKSAVLGGMASEGLRSLDASTELKHEGLGSLMGQGTPGMMVVYSMFGAFFVCYFASKNLVGDDGTKQAVAGLFGLILVLMVEMTLFVLRAHILSRRDVEYSKEEKRRETEAIADAKRRATEAVEAAEAAKDEQAANVSKKTKKGVKKIASSKPSEGD